MQVEKEEKKIVEMNMAKEEETKNNRTLKKKFKSELEEA